jgi:hypothetical protein
MNWSLWQAVAPILIVVIGATAFWRIRHAPARSAPAERSALFLALATCGATLFLIGAKVIDLGRGVTAVDLAALAIAGILTGCFLTLAIEARPRHEKNA